MIFDEGLIAIVNRIMNILEVEMHGKYRPTGEIHTFPKIEMQANFLELNTESEHGNTVYHFRLH